MMTRKPAEGKAGALKPAPQAVAVRLGPKFAADVVMTKRICATASLHPRGISQGFRGERGWLLAGGYTPGSRATAI